MKNILIIEDDPGIAELERDYLEASDFHVDIEADGTTGLKRALADDFDLLILDVMLPGMDGFQICRELRKEKELPILMVSARQEDIDKIRALGLGADDYIIKPFSPSELVARVKAHLTRYERLTGIMPSANKPKAIHIGALEIQPETRRVFRDDTEITLTNKEFELLLFLAENPGIFFSKDKLFDQIWGFDAIGDTATVMVHINRLREKIEPTPSSPIYIETVWGAGYRFCSNKIDQHQ